jgi:hypothetical protein
VDRRWRLPRPTYAWTNVVLVAVVVAWGLGFVMGKLL